jgi:radical SAM superfamily enzyme YgiQ (UPF0313 family)
VDSIKLPREVHVNILLVSPQTPMTFWSLKHAVRFVARKAAFPPLGLLTVAAMLPRSWNMRLVDMDVHGLRDADLRWADYVLIGAMIVHKQSIDEEIIPRCKRLGIPIIAGGPLFTTGYEEYAGAVHAVCGECEEIIDDVIRDMETGELKDRYESTHGFPDVTKTPVPRWDLIELRYYATMPVQFSRGCPFDCEFCDIIIMNGRKPRTKTPEQMVGELNALQDAGWVGTVFFVDDNFIGNKKLVKQFLRAMIDWRAERQPQMDFITEASVNLADDQELLDLMAASGFARVFIGIETPVPESLREAQKYQNTHGDLVQMVKTVQRSGMEVMGGFIIGFDNDPQEIFELQYDFIQKSGISNAMVGLLTALPKTQLWHRLSGEGRLDTKSTGNNTEAALNFIPKLDREFLVANYKRLMKSLYEPATYYRRVLTFLDEYGPRGPKLKLTGEDIYAFFRTLWMMGVLHRGRRAFWKYLATILVRYPNKLPKAIALAIHGFHFRTVAQRL